MTIVENEVIDEFEVIARVEGGGGELFFAGRFNNLYPVLISDWIRMVDTLIFEPF